MNLCLIRSLPRMLSFCIVGDQNVPFQNTPLWRKDYFELIILRNSRHRRSSENRVEITILYEKFIFIKEISTCKGVSLSVPGRKG